MFPGTGANGNGMPDGVERSGPVAALHQDRRLRPLPPDRRSGDAHLPGQSRPLQHLRRSVGAPSAIRSGRPQHDGRARQVRRSASARGCSAIGLIASRRANCPRPIRRVRRASSATSSSPNGIGPTSTSICTTRSRPISAIRPSTRNGLIYGAPEASSDIVPWLDPIDNKSGFIKSEYRDAKTPTTKNADDPCAVTLLGRMRRSGTATPTSTIRCSTRRAACG